MNTPTIFPNLNKKTNGPLTTKYDKNSVTINKILHKCMEECEDIILEEQSKAFFGVSSGEYIVELGEPVCPIVVSLNMDSSEVSAPYINAPRLATKQFVYPSHYLEGDFVIDNINEYDESIREYFKWQVELRSELGLPMEETIPVACKFNEVHMYEYRPAQNSLLIALGFATHAILL